MRETTAVSWRQPRRLFLTISPAMAAVRNSTSPVGIAICFARSQAALVRRLRCLFVLSFMAAIIGMPVGLIGSSADAVVDNAPPVIASGCRCGAAAQRAGQCCCFLERKPKPKAASCCSPKSKPTDTSCKSTKPRGSGVNTDHQLTSAAKERPLSTPLVKEDCPCGPKPTMMFVSSEPRVLPTVLVLVMSTILVERLTSISVNVCGQRSLPDVPPPESSLV